MTSKAPSIYYLALYRKGVMGNILPASSVIHTVIIPHFASEETGCEMSYSDSHQADKWPRWDLSPVS